MNDPAELRRFYDETVRPLVAYDEQYETDLLGTLSTFLECDANVNATAARLITHRHTIRYRFERVRELTGLDVSSTDGREKLSLGLKAMRVLGHRGAAGPGDRARAPRAAGSRASAVGAQRHGWVGCGLTAFATISPASSSGSVLRSARASTNAPSSAAIIAIVSSRACSRLDAGVGVARRRRRAIQLSNTSAQAIAHRLAGARDLERHGGDRARVGVVGLDQVLGGAGEEDPHAGDHVGRGVEHRRDQLRVQRARGPDRLGAELLLAAGEEVVQRAERRLRLGDDLLDAGGGVALAAEQLRAGLDDPFSCAWTSCRISYR